MARNETPAKILVDCPKCDGKGRITGFDHVVGGRCFECGGAKKIEVDALTAAEILDAKAGSLYYSAGNAMDSAFLGREDLVAATFAKMLSDMFKIGSVRARAVLNFIGEGRYWDNDDGMFRQLAKTDAVNLRAKLIEMGRASKAA